MFPSYLNTVEFWMDHLYIAAPGAGLRKEDRRKAIQVASMLDEIERAVRRISGHKPLVLVDAAAGKAYVALLAARLVLEPLRREATVIVLERDPRRIALGRLAAERLGSRIPIEFRLADVADAAAWPDAPALVTALHACGAAADAVIERATAAHAKFLLLVPCCTGNAVAGTQRALQAARTFGITHHAPVRRRFIQAYVDAERTRTLAGGGYHTEVVEFVAPTVTPHNLLWRARRNTSFE